MVIIALLLICLTSVNIRANDVFVLLSLDSNIGSHSSKNIIAL